MASPISQIDQFISFPFLSTFFLFLFILMKYWRNSKPSIHKLPPSPPKLPVIGNLHQLMTGSLLPHRAITNLTKKYGPIMHLQLGEQLIIVISSAEVASQVLKTHELNFSQRHYFPSLEIMAYKDASGLLLAPFGDYWRKLRKIFVMELLSAKRVQSFKSLREQEVWNLVGFITSQEGVCMNLGEKLYALSNDITCSATFGDKCKDQETFLQFVSEITLILGGFSLPDLYPSVKFLGYVTGMHAALKKNKVKIDKVLSDIINECLERKKSASFNYESNKEGVIDVLVKLQKSNELDMQLTMDHFKAVILDIISAGSETTSTAMEWAMAELIRNPRVMEKAQEEVRQACKGKTRLEEADIQNLDYLKLVIKETLRLHPPVPLIHREAGTTCEINGYQIPEKAKIIINSWGMGRDPNIWKEPNSFKPERFQVSSVDFKGTDFEYLPFGAGRRICPGILFATVEIETLLAQLLYHFDWKLPNGIKPEELDMTETIGVTAKKKEKLKLIATTSIPFSR